MGLDAIRDLAGPGIVFFVLVLWLVRKAWKASRTESALEENRRYDELQAARAQEAGDAERAAALRSPARPVALVDPLTREALFGAEVAGAKPEHLALVGALLAQARGEGEPVRIAWVKSFGEHAAWLEQRGTAGARRETLAVARIEAGKIAQWWSYR